jgi:hypothetical protein
LAALRSRWVGLVLVVPVVLSPSIALRRRLLAPVIHPASSGSQGWGRVLDHSSFEVVVCPRRHPPLVIVPPLFVVPPRVAIVPPCPRRCSPLVVIPPFIVIPPFAVVPPRLAVVPPLPSFPICRLCCLLPSFVVVVVSLSVVVVSLSVVVVSLSVVVVISSLVIVVVSSFVIVVVCRWIPVVCCRCRLLPMSVVVSKKKKKRNLTCGSRVVTVVSKNLHMAQM